MEVHSLVLHVAEADLNALVAKRMPRESPLEDVAIQIRPEGVCVKGVYPMLVNVAFESWWQLDIDAGKVSANMTRLKALGMPGMIFKSAILMALKQLAKEESWIQVAGENIHVDVEAIISREACHTRLNLRSIQCNDGHLVVTCQRQ